MKRLNGIDILIVVCIMAAVVLAMLPTEPYAVSDDAGFFTSPDTDSYLYARRAAEFAESGKIDWVTDRSEDPLMNEIPSGSLGRIPNLLPILAALAARMTGLDINAVTAYLCTILLACTAIPAYRYAARRSGRIGGVTAAFCAALAPSFVLHSLPGYFDTDALLAILPMTFLTASAESIESGTKRGRYGYAAIAGGALALLALSWCNWYVYGLLAVGLILLTALRNRSMITALPGLGTVIFLSVPLFVWTADTWNVLGRFTQDAKNWPDPGAKINELKPLSFVDTVMRFGGPILLLAAVSGAVILLTGRTRRDKYAGMFLTPWLLIMAGFAFYAQRFVELAALPAALLAGIFAGRVPELLRTLYKKQAERKAAAAVPDSAADLQSCEAGTDSSSAAVTDVQTAAPGALFPDAPPDVKSKRPSQKPPETESEPGRFLLLLSSVVIALVIIAVPFSGAFERADRTRKAIDTADFTDACRYLREETAEDAVIVSWWDYGYFYQYAARRMTLSDGGVFDGYQYAMLARGLTGESSAEAAGIFTELLGGEAGRDVYLVLTKDMPDKFQAIAYYALWDPETPGTPTAEMRGRSVLQRLYSQKSDAQGVFEPVYVNDTVRIFRMNPDLQEAVK